MSGLATMADEDAMEVDIVACAEWTPPSASAPLLEVVVDTNVLLDELATLDCGRAGVRVLWAQAAQQGGSMALRVPSVVLRELDGLKRGTTAVAAAARRAITWLKGELALGQARGGATFVLGQTRAQERAAGLAYVPPVAGETPAADDLIVACALQARDAMAERAAAGALPAPAGAVMLSNDRDLCVKTLVEGVAAFSAAEMPRTLSELVDAARRSLAGDALARARERLAAAQEGRGQRQQQQQQQQQRALRQQRQQRTRDEHESNAPVSNGVSRPAMVGVASPFDARDWFLELQSALERAADAALVALLSRDFGEDLWRDVVREEPPWDARGALELLRHQATFTGNVSLRRARDEADRLREAIVQWSRAHMESPPISDAPKLLRDSVVLCEAMRDAAAVAGAVSEAQAAADSAATLRALKGALREGARAVEAASPEVGRAGDAAAASTMME